MSELKFKKIPADRAEWLESRPWWNAQHTKLNKYLTKSYPGSHVVAPDYEVLPIKDLLLCGEFEDGSSPHLIPLQDSACHDNCRYLFGEKLIASMHTGYALSKDGLWRAHTWGKTKSGKIVETTKPRLLYYGCQVTEL